MAFIFLLAAFIGVAIGYPYEGWHSSQPQPVVDINANFALPTINVQAPAAPVQEEIPQPIYTLNTNVQQPILGTQTILEQQTLPVGQSAQQVIQQLTRPAMVREVQGKNMPILNGPQPITLPQQELTPQNVQYPVKSQQEQQENVQETLTQQVFAPHLQRILRHAVPVEHINVNRYIQPIVNREIQPVLEVQVQEGKQQPARIASKNNMQESGAPAPAPESPEAPEATPPTTAAPATPTPAGGFRTAMYRTGAISGGFAAPSAAAAATLFSY